jgi:6-phosphogluconolactonase
MNSEHNPSRRDFVVASAAGLFALARGSESSFSSDSSDPDGELMYVGTYTEKTRSEGVYLVRMDRNSGKLRKVGAVNVGPNPSFLALHPNGRVLYAVNEVEKFNGVAGGGVSAFAIAGGTGALTRRNAEPSGGAGTCYVSVDHTGRAVLVANYDAGSIAILPVQPDGSVAPATQVIQHKGSGPNKERQATPHAHCIVADPSNRFALAADLGADRIFLYHLDPAARTLRHVEGGDGIMPPGSGPRHIVFHPTLPLVYVATEMGASVARLRLDREHGKLTFVDTHSTLPAGWKGTNETADIHISPSGRSLYVSNRGPNTIAVFSLAKSSGVPTLEQTISTGGDWPRNFSLDPTGRWLLVANERSNSIVVFARDQQTGHLTATNQRLAIPSPVCLRFHAIPSKPA